MKTSESVKDLASAMVMVQKSVPAFPKTASGYGYKYTPIDDIINGLRPLLTANGLLLTQTVGDGGDDAITLTTTVIHAPSGEWLSETATIPAPAVGKANAAQQAGAAITYLRRYSLSALFFLASEGDSDAVNETHAPQPERKATPPAPQPATNGKAAPAATLPDKLRKQLHAVGTECYGDEWDDKRKAMSAAFGTESSNEWTEETAHRVIKGMQERIDKRRAEQPAQQEDLFGL